MNVTRITIALFVSAGTFVAAGRFAPAEARAQPPRSLDDELLKQLRADPVDELDRELFGPGDRQGRGGGPSGEEADDLTGRLEQELGTAAAPEEDNPLLEIGRQMHEVEGRIARNDSGPITQKLQQQIVSDLERLIKEARKRCKACRPGSKPPQQASVRSQVGQPRPKQGTGGQKPGQNPATTSKRQPGGNGQTRRPDMQEMREVLKALWGELPERERERLMQLPPEEFLPKYELLIEEYFRRLAEEKGR